MSTTGVTAPAGFLAAATAAGIKPSGKPDMALVINEGPNHNAAAVFTRNKVVAAPVKHTRAAVTDGYLRAVLFNAGNANACNGIQGEMDAAQSVAEVSTPTGFKVDDIAVCSTGIIGELLPMDKVVSGVGSLMQNLGDYGSQAAEAIMTTDTVPKETVVKAEGFTVGGMGKGVGMIAPSLATMLVLLTTDASASSESLDSALRAAVATTFNTLDIDGTTSTNDTVLLLASGASGLSPTQEQLNAAVLEACTDLAEQMQADAEGVTKRVTITVSGAQSEEDAIAAARTIGRDNLVKTALFGSDPNWGRVLAAVGMAPVELDPERITVSFNGHVVCRNSTGTPDAREVDLSDADIRVLVDLGTSGECSGTVRTTDLSHAYVEINSAYTT